MTSENNDEVYVNDLYRCQEVRQPEFSQFMKLFSYGLYFLTSCLIGTEERVRLRRQFTELQNEYYSIMANIVDYKWYETLSGSKSEGFRFASSDLDFMIIFRHVNVIHSITNHSMIDGGHSSKNTTMLLMECDKTRPGFALLKLVGDAYDPDVQRSLASYLGDVYVSSQIWREENPYKCKSSIVHGPCNSGVVGRTEYDHAFCLHSSTWPIAAYGCIDRLLIHKWPTFEVVNDIVKGGVHFVPISSKESQFEFLEWRLSFSIAERKLIHSMNHTQFMCYGLLKIFLKEAINNIKEIKSILCSYYLKTAVFWEILNPLTDWVPYNLLYCFWQCFRRLLLWVHNEYLPNFFVPENNMLVGKFQPGQKKMLIDHLTKLYSEGYACLLKCPTLQNVLTDLIHRPQYAYEWFDYVYTLQDCALDTERIVDIYNIRVMNTGIPNPLLKLETLNYLILADISPFVRDVMSILCRDEMSRLLIMYCSIFLKSVPRNNKDYYFIVRKSLTIINQCRVDCVNHYLYTAIFLHTCERYEDVIRLCRISKIKLQDPYLLYVHTCDSEKYREAGGKFTPYKDMLRKHIAYSITLSSKTCIPELRLEHEVARDQDFDMIRFPPLLIIEFLNCLSCYYLGYRQALQEAVSDLFALVHYDDGYHIQDIERAISWQILGLCQEMTRDYKGAHQSYSNALHEQYSYIRPASRRRLDNLV